MPAIYYRPRKCGYPFYYRVAERMAMRKISGFLMMIGLLDMLKQSAKNAVRTSRRANVILPLMATLASEMLQEEIWLVRSTYFTLPNDMTMLRFQSGFWDSRKIKLT